MKTLLVILRAELQKLKYYTAEVVRRLLIERIATILLTLRQLPG
jgi:hypothetical protein